MRLSQVEILIYYDGPELVICRDRVGTRYLCLVVEQSAGERKYICTAVSPQRLQSVRVGDTDLRDVYSEPETDSCFLVHTDRDTLEDCEPTGPLPLPLDERLLPLGGYYLEKPPVSADALVMEADEKRKTVVHLSLSPPEAGQDPIISTETLGYTLNVLHRLVKHAFDRVLMGLDRATRRALRDPDLLKLDVYAFSPGSFTLHLQSRSDADLFGGVEIERALSRVDELVRTLEQPESWREIIASNRGHLVTAYRDLLGMVVERGVPVSYRWASPSHMASPGVQINIRSAGPIYQYLRDTGELDAQPRTLTGVFERANMDKGSWCINDENEDRKFRGTSARGVSLNGVTLGTKRYRLSCLERVSTRPDTGAEILRLELQRLEDLP